VDRFCVVGPVEEHLRRLRELADLGVTQFNIYLMSGDEEATLDVYGKEILPEFTKTTAMAGKATNRRKAAVKQG
jgi:hypothetical protein